jgi:hypothetical protein
VVCGPRVKELRTGCCEGPRWTGDGARGGKGESMQKANRKAHDAYENLKGGGS